MRIFWVFLVTFLGSVAAADGGDAEVSCVVMETCVLPCSFQSYSDDVIHWFLMATREIRVHSFYNDQDQLGLQDQNFSGRTSLFLDQISRGNASLLLRGVKVQDEGTYECSTMAVTGHKQIFVSLKVEAPASAVRISQEGDRISCSSEGIYPQPELTWSTIPPSSITLNESTSIQQTEDQLYSISSSLMVSDGGSGLSYSCTVRTRSNRKRATFKQLPSVTMTTPETTLPCLALKTSLMKLVWRFNHELILNQTGTKLSVSEGWRKHVKQVSEHGNLTLQGLSPGLEGAYS